MIRAAPHVCGAHATAQYTRGSDVCFSPVAPCSDVHGDSQAAHMHRPTPARGHSRELQVMCHVDLVVGYPRHRLGHRLSNWAVNRMFVTVNFSETSTISPATAPPISAHSLRVCTAAKTKHRPQGHASKRSWAGGTNPQTCSEFDGPAPPPLSTQERPAHLDSNEKCACPCDPPLRRPNSDPSHEARSLHCRPLGGGGGGRSTADVTSERRE